MKLLLVCVGLFMVAASGTFAQDPEVSVDRSEPKKITDSEGVVIRNTIMHYVEAKDDRLELLDRKKGKVVTLRLDRLVADDPGRVVYTRIDRVAVCGECTELDSGGGETGDKYEVWFVMQRGSAMISRVLEVIVKSVNGNPMYAWHRDKYGEWTAELIPDPEE